ncbi:SDR family NAD(P)-dependent oxidoreductase [Pseudoalteromonas sp. OOF1S-7]|uniref:SDR family NAD(P)-dependent oxidoreductase n=1 Tax=Pseudoalteromonas sp. OOF1S-7 TaxID=2917757 RepID=UPI001EF57DE9|nr:SDR family NAD(P)-dependent oxidoreductase [Pseudoalteromonas sp. OOF1S-7]MCG7534955.1 SDR family NAD(P)-dependent oxidoreductase [Pseudoalteromonas sp. OOF1S-7]
MPEILITGASSGIGLALAKRYVDAGYKVHACGRNKDKLQAMLPESEQVRHVCFDLNDKAAIFEVAKDLPDLDGIILNAGGCEYIDDAKQFDSALFERVISVNLISVGYCLDAWLSKLTCASFLVFVSSSASFLALPRAEAYGASKAGLTYLAKALDVDLAGSGIQVSVVHPGFVDTPLTRRNDFPMPCQITSAQAAERIFKGVEKKQFDIHFPRRFTYLLKFFGWLPHITWRHLAAKWIKR